MRTTLDLENWDYDLPPDRIARRPVELRHDSRLLVLPLDGGEVVDRRFRELPALLRPGDLLVANDSRVMASRLSARRQSGGAVELLLLEPGPGPVEALARPARRLAANELLLLAGGGEARIVEVLGEGRLRVELDRAPTRVMAEQGEMPLPPYLERRADPLDAERYQTIYAGPLGSAAAPTAGLHITETVLSELEARGIRFARVTLHVGLGTFKPLRPEDLAKGVLHREHYEVSDGTAQALAATRAEGGRVIAVGTTSARTLEAATPPGARLPRPGSGQTNLFLRPPYRFRAIDGLITNFHLPRSSLLMMVACLCGRARLLEAYREAVARGYRFYSYGDAMLLL